MAFAPTKAGAQPKKALQRIVGTVVGWLTLKFRARDVRPKPRCAGSKAHHRIERERPDARAAVWFTEFRQSGVVKVRVATGEIQVSKKLGIECDAAACVEVPAVIQAGAGIVNGRAEARAEAEVHMIEVLRGSRMGKKEYEHRGYCNSESGVAVQSGYCRLHKSSLCRVRFWQRTSPNCTVLVAGHDQPKPLSSRQNSGTMFPLRSAHFA